MSVVLQLQSNSSRAALLFLRHHRLHVVELQLQPNARATLLFLRHHRLHVGGASTSA